MNRIRYYLFHEYLAEESYDSYDNAEWRLREICAGLKLNCYYVHFESDEPDSDYHEIVFFEGIHGYGLRKGGETIWYNNYEEGLAEFFECVAQTNYPCTLEIGNDTFQATLDYDVW